MKKPLDPDPNDVGAALETEPFVLPFRAVRGFSLVVVEGPDTGQRARVTGDRISIGTHPSNDLVLTDKAVSRFHCELVAEESRVHVRDVGSSNGTSIDGVVVLQAIIQHGQTLRLASTAIRFESAGDDESTLPSSQKTRFGSLVGVSRKMRTVMAQLEMAARSDATLLLEGETGTGKGAAVDALHAASARAKRPLVVLDCGAIPANLLESELFGHERGAYTGAVTSRSGAFEEANGGTVFLDEIGEMPIELQPKLLRVLENRTVKRVGSGASREIDVRIVAATNRDLRAEVNAGRFRADLFYRLAVVRIQMPPVRDRLEDLPMLVDALLASLGTTPPASDALRTSEFLATLARGDWPGNVRQLRNHLERCLVFESPQPLEGAEQPAAHAKSGHAKFAEARQAALDEFERAYVAELMERFPGRVAEAAQAAGIHRVHVYRLLRRHGVRP